MPRVYFRLDGTATPHPTDKEAAAGERKAKYDDSRLCPHCLECSIKYVVNDRCVHCARLAAMAFYNEAIGHRSDPATADRLPAELVDEGRRGWAANPHADTLGHAPTPDRAARIGSPVWVRLDPCPRAGHPGVRTLSDRCWFCEQDRARPSRRQAAITEGKAWYTPGQACPRCGTTAARRVSDGRCAHCFPIETQSRRLTARQQAIADGRTWYTPDRPCRRCGTCAERRVRDAWCSHCQPPTRSGAAAQESPSPRQQAIADGRTWYTPDQPCKRCGTRAERRVNDGRCAYCQPPRRDRPPADTATLPADLVIARGEARALGMTVYRTGRACRHGHTGFRYVSTGACVDCLRGA